MKQFRRFLGALLLIGMAIAIYSSAVGETAPEKINWGGAELAAGSWARTADAMEFSYPMDAARDEPTILLRSAWQKYQSLWTGMPFIRLPVSGTARSICSGCRRGRN